MTYAATGVGELATIERIGADGSSAMLGRIRRAAILRVMTKSLDAVIAKLATLPADEQDRIAGWLLEEPRDDERWAAQFGDSQDALSTLAAEARADRAARRTTELDADKL